MVGLLNTLEDQLSLNSMKVRSAITLKPNSVPTNQENGDIYYDSTRNTIVMYINGNWVDHQSRSDVASAASLTSTNFTASIVQSTLVRITGSTSGTITGLTAPSDAKYLILYNESTVLQTIANQSGTEGTAANRIICPNSANVAIPAGQSVTLVYDSSQSRWILLSAPSSSVSGGSGGSKNYLSAYTASTSSNVQNPGNGNWELGSTSGWSLAHSTLSSGIPSSTASAGSAFSASSGGSAASGNLSISTVNAGTQIAGSYSGSLVSSAASTAGDMLISNAFFIDSEDQAKVLTFKAYYDPATVGGLNFSGTSSNGFAIWIYDITNGAWIMPAGIYSMAQSSGIGYITGTFQTTSNTTEYQIAFININASTGAYTMYIDDISVGPQTAPMGPAVTDWVSFTPTGSWTTNTTYTGQWRRVGDSMEVRTHLALAGAPTTATLTVNLPSGYTIDSTKIDSSTALFTQLGTGRTLSAGNGYALMVLFNSTTSVTPRGFITNTGANPVQVPGEAITQAIPSTYTSGDFVDLVFSVPIVGWSSNLNMSNDTDTRVVAALIQGVPSGTPQSTNTVVKYPTTTNDTHGGYSSSTGLYTVPVTGYYNVSGGVRVNATFAVAATVSIFVAKNGTVMFGSSNTIGSVTESTLDVSTSVNAIFCNANDTLSMQANTSGTSPTWDSNTAFPFFSVTRVSGPAVVAATESVNMSYTDTSGGAIGTSAAAYSFGTKNYDSHNAYSGSTYTVPVSGKYRISAQMSTAAVANTTSGSFNLYIYKNGTQQIIGYTYGNGVSHSQSTLISGSISCIAGDTIQIFALSTIATTGNTTAGWNLLSIERVGN